MKQFRVTLKEQKRDRPSGHNDWSQKLNYSEEFCCPHAEDHAKTFIAFFDLSAIKCGFDKNDTEFIKDPAIQKILKDIPDIVEQISKITQDIKALHAKCYPQEPEKPRFSLKDWKKEPK